MGEEALRAKPLEQEAHGDRTKGARIPRKVQDCKAPGLATPVLNKFWGNALWFSERDAGPRGGLTPWGSVPRLA
jgi:hypothetical protein